MTTSLAPLSEPTSTPPSATSQSQEAVFVPANLSHESACKVAALTASARFALKQAAVSLTHLCVDLYHLSNLIRTGPQSSEPGSKTDWTTFCERNFPNLHLRSIYRYVSVGEFIYTKLSSEQSAIHATAVQRLGFSVLNELAIMERLQTGESAEAVEAVLTKAGKGEKVSHDEVVAIKRELENAEIELSATRQRLTQAEIEAQSARSDAEKVISDLNSRLVSTAKMQEAVEHLTSQLKDSEAEIVDMQAQLREARRRAATPVEAIKIELPKGVKTEQEALERIRSQAAEKEAALAELEKRRAALTADIQAATDKLSKLSSQSADESALTTALSQLRADVERMLIKYPTALLASISGKPAHRAEIKRIGEMLIQLANTMTKAV